LRQKASFKASEAIFSRCSLSAHRMLFHFEKMN
jgi:hypothetical protein